MVSAFVRQAIEADVRAIANDEHFATDEVVKAEVERRIAGIEHTRRIMAEVAVKVQSW